MFNSRIVAVLCILQKPQYQKYLLPHKISESYRPSVEDWGRPWKTAQLPCWYWVGRKNLKIGQVVMFVQIFMKMSVGQQFET
jgi:hypothetical protein